MTTAPPPSAPAAVAPASASALKRAAILDAAEAAFLRDGYLGSSMDAIALTAGVSKQTVYAHFGSKEALFVAIVGGMTSATSDRVHGATVPEGIDGATVGDFLADYALRQLHAVLDPRIVRLRRLVIAEATRFPDLGRELWRQGPQRALAELAATLAELDRRGVVGVDDPERAAEQLNWLVMGGPLNRAMLLGDGPEAVASDTELAAHATDAVGAFLRIHPAGR